MADSGRNPKLDEAGANSTSLEEEKELEPLNQKDQSEETAESAEDNGEGTTVKDSKDREPTRVTITKRKTRRKKIRVELIKEPAGEPKFA
jgi:hypothetical protein